MTDRELINAAIAASGLGAGKFARYLMGRNERAGRYWQTGENALPEQAREWLERFMALSPRARATVVRILAA